jgi:hypothetical protein
MNDTKEFDQLSPFERTVLLEIARTQALASAAFQVSYASPGENLPPAKEILEKALGDQMTGILETLRNSQ